MSELWPFIAGMGAGVILTIVGLAIVAIVGSKRKTNDKEIM